MKDERPVPQPPPAKPRLVFHVSTWKIILGLAIAYYVFVKWWLHP